MNGVQRQTGAVMPLDPGAHLTKKWWIGA